MTPLHVLFFGDSICAGQYVSVDRIWVTQVAMRLSDYGRQHGRQIAVSNTSVNGRTTRQALERMAYEVQAQPVKILVVQFGMNDCNYWSDDHGLPRVSPLAFAANLHEVIDRGFRSGVKRLVLITNHPTGRDQVTMPSTSITYQQSNKQYNEIIREVAAANSRTVLIDVEKSFLDHIANDRNRLPELLLPEPDLLHLSERGHNLYTTAVYPTLERLVLELFNEMES